MNTTLEPCFNLWLFVDPLTGVVQTGAAKAYALHGTEQERKDLLRRLAPTDFYTVPRVPVPQHYVLAGPDGRQVPGAFQAGGVGEAQFLSHLLQSLEPLPQQLTMPEGMPVGYSLPIPVDALAIVTPVEERYDGTLVPVVKRAGGVR